MWILAFGPAVIVPLGLTFIARRTLPTEEWRWVRFGTWCSLPAAAAFIAGIWFAQGTLAASFAAPWLLTTLLLSVAGVIRLWRNGLRMKADTAVAAALLFLPVGANWALISRAGLRPQGFSHEIVLLTGVHFHYAGFALPLLAAAAVTKSPIKWHQVLIAAVIVGVPAVGVGISLSPMIEVVAALVLALACLALAAMQVREALLRSKNANAAMLLLISSTSIAAAMVLAGVYAVGEFSEVRWLSIPAMIQTHGLLNAFGFALCGLIARLVGGESDAAA